MRVNNILSYLERNAGRYPEKTAFVSPDESVSFSELKKRAMAAGTFIAGYSRKKKPVLIVMEKCINEIVCFLGALYSGNFYCPADPSLPALRLTSIIKTLSPCLIITSPDTEEKLTEIFTGLGINIPVISCGERMLAKTDMPLLETIRKDGLDIDPMYVMFTSGSTGVPKGVCISHMGVIGFIESFTSAFNLSAEAVIANQAPFDFDVSVKDIYSGIKTGATVCLIPRLMFSFPEQLTKYLKEHKVNTLIWAVSALSMLANADAFMYDRPDSLDTVMFSGEALPVKHLNYWRKHFPESRFINLYGPTEVTCNCMYYVVDRDFADTDMLPLGNTFEHTEVLVLNEENCLVGKGETGEICVRGSSLALGYYNNPDQTAQAFTSNPLNKNLPDRIYRTGDLARLGEDGEYYFASRKDFQIKHLGHRIELNEVELAVNSLGGILSAVCLYDEAKQKIALIYRGGLTPKDIFEGLRPIIPKFMFPQTFIQVDEMPYTKNGKIDRLSLRREYISEEG